MGHYEYIHQYNSCNPLMTKKLAIVLVYLVIILAANNNTLVFAQKIKTASENMYNVTSSDAKEPHYLRACDRYRLHI
jgi:hypothetical protein